MIISASRRTDIPAFYSDWFFHRLEEEYCTVFNPFNRNQVRYVSLKPDDIDVVVFWTKHSKPFRPRLQLLDERKIQYYFQYTLVHYSQMIEKRVPPFDKLLEEFLKLSDQIGPDRVIWRYDPIIFSKEYSVEQHIEYFAEIAKKLKGQTNRVMISIVDYYQKTLRNMKDYSLRSELDEKPEQKLEFGDFIRSLSQISRDNGFEIQSCSEPIEMDQYGVTHGKCIDDNYILEVFERDVIHKKDPGQRKECGCVKSIDIGVYDTCLHGCQYCYATKQHDSAKRNYDSHDPKSPSLIGWYDAEPPVSDPQVELF